MNDLNDLRIDIDSIDEEILNLLVKRLRFVKEIGKYKKEHSLSVIDKNREHEIIQILKKKAKKANISKSLVKAVWKAIFKESYSKE